MFRTAEKRLWLQAKTLDDVGDLIADWLDGRTRYNPGYGGHGGPDPETSKIGRQLAAANRAGYVTVNSQPGWDDRQCAAVEGFADEDTATLLARMAGRAGLIVVEHPACAPRRRNDYSRCVPSNIYKGRVFADFGMHYSRREIAGLVLSGESYTALLEARQIALVDMEWGRNDRLWPLLTQFAEQQRRRAA